MMDQLTLRDLQIGCSRGRQALAAFLASQGLGMDADMEYAVGAFDGDDNLLACGGYAGAVLKGFAVAGAARGNNILGSILSHLMSRRISEGVSHLLVFTRPGNRLFFEGAGFHEVGGTETAILLENRRDGLKRFARERLLPEDTGVPAGALVMNCNPFTLGHRHLVEYAAARCQLVHVFLVEEDRSIFPFAQRLEMLRRGTADLPNVRVASSGPYMISAATFPAYFLKERETPQDVGARLDVALFGRLAPLFSIHTRFVGEEPFCAVTRAYNALLRENLPPLGVTLEEVPRLALDGEAVSASRVRRLLEAGELEAVRHLVPESTFQLLQDQSRPLLK